MNFVTGSHALQNLVASDDAFTVSRIKDRGEGGCFRLHEHAGNSCRRMRRSVGGSGESPNNKDYLYLAPAPASGSSRGSGAVNAARFDLIRVGKETYVSSSSPAPFNGLVACTAFRRIISIS